MQMLTYSFDTPLMRATLTTVLDDAQVPIFIREAARMLPGFAVDVQTSFSVEDAASALESAAREYNACRRATQAARLRHSQRRADR